MELAPPLVISHEYSSNLHYHHRLSCSSPDDDDDARSTSGDGRSSRTRSRGWSPSSLVFLEHPSGESMSLVNPTRYTGYGFKSQGHGYFPQDSAQERWRSTDINYSKTRYGPGKEGRGQWRQCIDFPDQ